MLTYNLMSSTDYVDLFVGLIPAAEQHNSHVSPNSAPVGEKGRLWHFPNVGQIAGAALVFLLTLASSPTYADTYVLAKSPKYSHGTGHIEEAYEVPDDSDVCDLYLRNLQYFAKRNVAMSCKRKIAPSLDTKIREMKWENLDPLRYSELFESLIQKEANSGPAKPSEIEAWKKSLAAQQLIFQRAVLQLTGYPNGADQKTAQAPPERFQIIYYGINAATEEPSSPYRCIPKRGGPSPDGPSFYLAPENLSRLYGSLNSVADGYGTTTMISILDRPYVEEIFSDGDIRLSRIDLAFPVVLQPVCLYNFQRTGRKGK